MNIFTQIIGALGYIILSLSYFNKEKRGILFIQIFAAITFALHYYLLGAITGTVCNLINMLIITVIYLYEKNNGKNKKALVLFMIPLLVVISLLTYDNIFSIFPIIASIITMLSFLSSSENLIRLSGLLSSLGWLVYSVIHKSYVAIGFGIYTIISTSIALYKNRNVSKKEQKMLDNKEVIIFDLDGTLLNSVNMFNEIYSVLIKRICNKDVSTDQIQEDWDTFAHQNQEGDLYDNFLIYLNNKYSSKSCDLEFLRKLYSEIEYQYISEEVQYKKFAKETVLELNKRGYKLALATLSTRRIIDIYNSINKKLIKDFKICEIFDLVLTYEDVKEKKPNPEVYLTTIKKLNVSKKKCLIIEDSLEGVMAANNAGVEVLNVVDANMYKTQKQIDKLTTYKMNSLEDLYKLIKSNKQ